MADYDFSGWATKANIKCSDGRTILPNAFKDNDGQTVPLVWNHQHNDVDHVLGHALLENREEGVYAYCKLNDNPSGQVAKELIKHGDVNALSIYANQLKEKMSCVIHGNIRELSLVLAGANTEALIDNVIMHGDEMDDEAYIYHGEEGLVLEHADEGKESSMAEETKSKETTSDNGGSEKKDDKTVQEVIDTMNDEQQKVMYALIGEALGGDDEEDDESEGGNESMKHNVFDNEVNERNAGVLTHSDQESILELAKKSQVGSFQAALQMYADEHELAHAETATASGFAEGEVSKLFTEYKEVRPGAPELITSDQGWISVVMRKVHKSPISRIRTSQVDIRNIDQLRARGYKKGNKKALTGNFRLVRRTTDPQTVYVKNALHRDDITDITDFNYVTYLYNIDKMMLNEELATAIMIGDGREEGDEYKIGEDKIRPIWLDDDLYTLHVDIDIAGAKKELQGTNTGANFGENYIQAEAMINTVLYAREKYKGTGTPDMFITPHDLNVMLLARDLNGRRIYSSKAELASALNVGEIITAEQFEGKVRTTDQSKKKKLRAIIANLADYSLGATKGGEVTHFTQFDIDFNQEKSLLETRVSGALTRVYSAIAIEEDVTDSF